MLIKLEKYVGLVRTYCADIQSDLWPFKLQSSTLVILARANTNTKYGFPVAFCFKNRLLGRQTDGMGKTCDPLDWPPSWTTEQHTKN